MRHSLVRELLPFILGTALLVVGASSALAQDANYWTNQYGNQARLLGGAVVGSSKDVSAVFYNPGRFSLTSNPELLLAGNVIRFNRLTLENALGSGLDLSSQRVAGVPSLFAGEFRFGEPGGHRFAYSFLTRYDISINLEQRADLTDLFPTPVDLFTASISLREGMNEYWGGLTWSYPLSEGVGVGVTVFGLVRDQSSRAFTLAQAENVNGAGIAVQRKDFDYLYIGALAKLGIGADLGDWRLGLALTTPNLKITGSGKYGYDESVVAQALDGDGTEASQINSGFQEDLGAEYNSPLSIAGGVGYTWMRTRMDVTVEWFDAVDTYDVLDPDPFSSSDGSEVRKVDLIDSRKSVTNIGISLEHAFNERVDGYLSFRTDNNASDTESRERISIATWDLYHFAGGASFPIGHSSFTIGAVFARGSETLDEGVDLIPGDDPGGDEGIDVPQDIHVKFTQLTFILGFTISF